MEPCYTSVTPYDPNGGPNDYDCEPETGPYMTIQDFRRGVANGTFGPDEDCRWVYIDSMGNLQEKDIKHPREVYPPDTIAVAYYAQ